jgi:hypothetical protein
MNKEAQRIAIHEARGFIHQAGEPERYGGPPTKVEGFFDPDGKFHLKIPDYLNDLNAMAEAEYHLCSLENNCWRTYVELLEGWLTDEALFATAAQRAEAFLKTLSLWEEDPSEESRNGA